MDDAVVALYASERGEGAGTIMNANDDSNEPALEGKHESLWIDTTLGTDFGALDDGIDVNVAVLGGGITGITAATKLKAAGKSVAVVERDRILEGVTGHTTAKLTSLHGLVYDHLIEYFGEDRALQYAKANQSAIDDVESTIEEHDIDCDFRTNARVHVHGIS